MRELLKAGMIYGRYSATSEGMNADPATLPLDRFALVEQGFARVEGLRYEDFLPVSAAGIFASNLNQYGTKSTAAVKPQYTQAQLEAVMGRGIISTDEQYEAIEAASLMQMYSKLRLLDKLPAADRHAMERAASKTPTGAMAEALV
jgi:uncharacterized glyoxalase superfamily metalloenzyme YdcJ